MSVLYPSSPGKGHKPHAKAVAQKHRLSLPASVERAPVDWNFWIGPSRAPVQVNE
jgi:hypothetical protein